MTKSKENNSKRIAEIQLHFPSIRSEKCICMNQISTNSTLTDATSMIEQLSPSETLRGLLTTQLAGSWRRKYENQNKPIPESQTQNRNATDASTTNKPFQFFIIFLFFFASLSSPAHSSFSDL